MNDMTGRTALVTGAAGAIGAATAAAFARAGARLVITDRRADDLNRVAAALEEAGGQVLAIACDQTDPSAVSKLYSDVSTRFGGLDAAFINAGYGRYGSLLDLSFDHWKRHIDVNLNGGFLMAQGAARVMAEGGRGGAITMTASTAAAYVCDLLGAYAASKAGIRMLSRALASELGVHRIRVNVVMPGVIETPMTQSMLDDPEVRADVLANTPAGRMGAPDDIAALVLFLSGDGASYITGAEILADGGQTIHGYPRWYSADYRLQGAPFLPHHRP